ncbi:MAG: glycosyltransferase, partial [Rubrivivax sp.]|nr:glycosyltransferase [Pyrinomonadaceae bacterium]
SGSAAASGPELRRARDVKASPSVPDPASAERAANRKWATQVAVFDDHMLTPDRDAGSLRMLFVLRALSEWCHPVFITTSKQRLPEYEKLLWEEGFETACALDYRRLFKERRFRAAILSRPTVAEMLLGHIRRADPRVKIIFDTVDVHFLRLAREAEVTCDRRLARKAARFHKLETRLARASDMVWYASSTDRDAMEREAPGIPSIVVPTIHAPRERGLPFGERDGLLFVGNFRHRPNADAVRFFAREVLPLVRRAVPDVELLVVGDNAPPDFAEHAPLGVRVLGFVPDIDPLLARSRVFVAPLRFGAGMKGKIGEALAYGIPVVTTTIGAEGISLRDGQDALIADSPEDFAAAVLRAYRDAELWRRLSDEGYAHVARNFSPEVISRVINDSVRGLFERTETGAARGEPQSAAGEFRKSSEEAE